MVSAMLFKAWLRILKLMSHLYTMHLQLACKLLYYCISKFQVLLNDTTPNKHPAETTVEFFMNNDNRHYHGETQIPDSANAYQSTSTRVPVRYTAARRSSLCSKNNSSRHANTSSMLSGINH